jgi:hypothetical protein
MSSSPICRRGEPLAVLARRPTAWITTELERSAPGFPGVVSRRHVVEPYQVHRRTIPHVRAHVIPRHACVEPVHDLERLRDAPR